MHTSVWFASLSKTRVLNPPERLGSARNSLSEGARETATGTPRPIVGERKSQHTIRGNGCHLSNLPRFKGSARKRNARRFALYTTRCRSREIRLLSRGRPFASRKVMHAAKKVCTVHLQLHSHPALLAKIGISCAIMIKNAISCSPWLRDLAIRV